eukprot:TRINITY_DN56556_c0_g1_i1.p1 TRINITY_DN56556_c0_g1~~TRINITY_DN56556_c0_g1_i1.p1  ORF type:complete len:173 (+),score=23.45 TRINITY_DN56556_c0_g1_i1:246-764(+)
MQDEKLIVKIESSTEYVSQSQTIVCSQNSPPPPRPSISSKSIDRQSPEHSDLIILSSEVDRGNSNIVSNPPLSPLQDTLLSEEDSGAESSTSSVRHSRPRDTIRSIHALRFSPTTTPTVLSAIANDELPTCLLYTSDAADEEDSVDLGGRRIIKKKNTDGIRFIRRKRLYKV